MINHPTVDKMAKTTPKTGRLSGKTLKAHVRRPVIMQVIPELGAGGAEQGCIDICAALVQAGAQALVVTRGGSRTHDVTRAGGTVITMPVHSKNPVVMMRNVWRLRRLIRKHDIDIVHARSRAPAWSCLQACKGTKARYMTTCHAPYNIGSEVKRFYNSAIAQGERVIAISEYVADYLKREYQMNSQNIRVIHRGLALEKFHPTAVTPERLIKLSRLWRLPDGASIVFMPGRITRWKGHHILIEAIKILDRADVFCVMAGDDQGRDGYRRELEESIAARGLEGRVRIVDHCDDMPAAYMLANVVVSASTEPEGFGRVPMEAQAMGRPVIATDHGGARETIKRGETGWLIPPGNAQALAQAIGEALVLDPLQRAMLATAAMSHIAQSFTRERMADQTLDVYTELLGESLTATEPAKMRTHVA